MSRRPRVGRAVVAALGLSLLLLADALVLTAAPALAADTDAADPAGADVEEFVCTPGFEDISNKAYMSLHGVTLTRGGALAVGFSRSPSSGDGRRHPAVLVNDRESWTRVYASSPGNEDGLVAVASNKDDDVWAVGFTTSNGQVTPLAMRWNGRDWKVDRPFPRGRMHSVFTDVLVMENGRPFTVGYRMALSGRRLPLAMRMAGRRWVDVSPQAGRRETVSLTGMSPDRRGGLWAVGYAGPGAEIHPIVYRRFDGRWTRMKTPRIRGEAVLSDVVATSRKESWAVGYQRSGGRSKALVLHWDGKAWRRVHAPVFDSDEVVLSAVSAAPGGGIWVVGAAWNPERRTHEAVAAWWDGQAWNKFSGVAGGNELHDVIGSLDKNGWAVGRAGEAGRAERVCIPAGSSIFGGSGPSEPDAPRIPQPTPGLVAGGSSGSSSAGSAGSAGGSSEAAAASAVSDAGGQDEGASAVGSAPTKVVAARNPIRLQLRKAARARSGQLPPAEYDRRIFARDVAAKVGIGEETSTYGAVVADFDADGVDDLYIGRHGRTGVLYLNRDGTFVRHQPMRFPSIDRHGCTAADIDGSGLPDLYCAIGGKRGSGFKANELWLDPGGPEPREVAVERGLADVMGRGRLTAFLESRKQDDVSLIVTNSPMRIDGLPSVGRHYVTRGDGEFKNRARVGFAPRLGALTMQDADYDRDGREDLLLVTGGLQALDQPGTMLYRNTRRGLVDVTKRMGIRSFGEVDAELVDLDRDHKLDLVQLSPTRLRVSVYKNGRFRKVYERRLTWGKAIASGDVNGDGRGDLYVLRSNGSHNPEDVLLLNRGGGRAWASMIIPQVSGGTAEDAYAIDHDGNGLDDFLVLNGHNDRGPIELIAFYRR